ncbi:MAG: sugar phosphate isomerase/epimerase [Clostridiales bacterium]|nr:sugar phosphate isomerase/epimerase [Clostridiales bacterium]
MKIGISTSTFFNTIAPENMFELMRGMRIDTTEFYLQTFSEYEKQYVDTLAALRGSVNVVAVSPLSIQFEPQLFSPSLRVRSDAEILFKKVCYAASALGAKYYTFRGQANLSAVKDFDYQKIAQRYNQLIDMAATYGIALSLKNMRWSFASTPDYFEKLFALCPRLNANFDMYNAELAGYDIREFFDVCPPQRISHIGVTDMSKGVWTLPGKGKFNFEKLFTDIDRRKITAPVFIACPSDCYSDYLQVQSGFDYLNGAYSHIK